MKRVFLLIVILSMCLFVVIGGAITFLNSNSVLMNNATVIGEESQRDLSLLLNMKSKSMHVLRKGKIIKTYSIQYDESRIPFSSGNWKILRKEAWGESSGEKWLGINAPWGKVGIHGDKEPWQIGIGMPLIHSCIKLKNADIDELYQIIKPGTKIKVYDDMFFLSNDSLRVLKPMDRGADVYEVQRKLKIMGYYSGYLNGVYNKGMEGALHKFQKEKGLRASDYVSIPEYTKLGMFSVIK